jgi:hypothetical protein
MEQLCLHSLIHVHGVMRNWLRTRSTLPLPLPLYHSNLSWAICWFHPALPNSAVSLIGSCLCSHVIQAGIISPSSDSGQHETHDTHLPTLVVPGASWAGKTLTLWKRSVSFDRRLSGGHTLKFHFIYLWDDACCYVMLQTTFWLVLSTVNETREPLLRGENECILLVRMTK